MISYIKSRTYCIVFVELLPGEMLFLSLTQFTGGCVWEAGTSTGLGALLCLNTVGDGQGSTECEREQPGLQTPLLLPPPVCRPPPPLLSHITATTDRTTAQQHFSTASQQQKFFLQQQFSKALK